MSRVTRLPRALSTAAEVMERHDGPGRDGPGRDGPGRDGGRAIVSARRAGHRGDGWLPGPHDGELPA